MIRDLITIAKKELKEVMLKRGSYKSGLINLLIVIGVFGVFMPLQNGKDWLSEPANLLMWAWVPVFMTMSISPDSIAGERERRTLETLLASRLSDRAIILGKIFASVGYVLIVSLLSMASAVIALNIVIRDQGFLFYPGWSFPIALLVNLLTCFLMGTLGTLLSINASSGREVYQKLSIGFLVIAFLPMILLKFLPKPWLAWISEVVTPNALAPIAIGVVILILLINAVLLRLALNKFQRHKVRLS